jgi:VanZ family protein
MGHIVEFALLGIELALLAFHLSSSFKLRDAIYAAFGGLLVANVDELIQTFTARGSAVSDVFIDLGGLVFGLAVGYGIVYGVRAILRSARAKREERSHAAAKA